MHLRVVGGNAYSALRGLCAVGLQPAARREWPWRANFNEAVRDARVMRGLGAASGPGDHGAGAAVPVVPPPSSPPTLAAAPDPNRLWMCLKDSAMRLSTGWLTLQWRLLRRDQSMCETFPMTFVAEAFGGWLVGQVADATRKGLADRLLGSDQERALQKAATAAIKVTAQQFRPGSAIGEDALGADHLARVIDHVFRTTPMTAESFAGRATLLQGLQIGVAAHLAVLGDSEITGTGESSSEVLGVPVPAVVETLTRKLLQEIMPVARLVAH
jgi:hypothetical protein